MKRAQAPLIDNRVYTVVCAQARFGPFETQVQARNKAYSLIEEWAALGYNGGRGRTAEIFYRDGTLQERITHVPHCVTCGISVHIGCKHVK